MALWTTEERLNYIYAFMKFDMKDMELDFWQDDFIASRSRYISILKSRRTGFSFATALKGLVKAMDPERTKYVKQFVSYNESDAIEKIRYALEFYESIPVKYRKKIVHKNATELEFRDTNGKTTSRLISLPCRPPRGKGGDISLDEYAIYLPKVSNMIYTAALYVIMRGGCIEVGSTPLGTIGKFYDICTKIDDFPDYERYNVPWWYAGALCNNVEKAVGIAEDMPTEERVEKFGSDILKTVFRNSTLEDFQQECECTFLDSASSYISLELIYANTPGRRESDIPSSVADDNDYFIANRDVEIKTFTEVDDLLSEYNPELHGSPLFLGYDVAKERDAIAFYIIGLVDGKKRSVMRIEKYAISFEEQKNIMRRLLNGLPVYRACMDSTGMGAPLYEELNSEFGERLEGVDFTLKSKEILAMNVKFSLEKREFLLENNREFHAQIHSIKRMPSAGGSFRYDAERNEKGHADSFWAWALANNAIAQSQGTQSFYDKYGLHKKQKSEEPKRNIRQKGKPLASILRGLQKVEN